MKHHATIQKWRDKYGWKDDLEVIESRVREQMLNDEIDRRVKTNRRQMQILDYLTFQVAKHIETAQKADELIPPGDLQKLVNSFSSIVDKQRLIGGDVTDRTETQNVTLRDVLLGEIEK